MTTPDADEPEPAEAEAEVAEPAPAGNSRVHIEAAGRAVQVESPDSLDAVAAIAVELWKVTDDPRILRGHSTIGFTAELFPQPDYSLTSGLGPAEPEERAA